MTEEIAKRKLTTGEHEGSGIYDELMRTSKSHIHAEFTDGRIVSESYGEVYLGVMQSNLQAALQFVLESPLRNQQLEILKEQVAQAKTQTELTELQKEAQKIANDTAQYHYDNILPLQKAQLEHQNNLLNEQIQIAAKQVEELTQRINLLKKQEDLVDEQILAERDRTTNPTGGTNKAAFDKTLKETELLNQRLITEKYQTSDTVEGVVAKGLVGKEVLLKNNQAESFLRNAELQTSKVYADVFAAMYSTEPEGMDNQAWGLGSDESFEVFKKLTEGINITRPPTSS